MSTFLKVMLMTITVLFLQAGMVDAKQPANVKHAHVVQKHVAKHERRRVKRVKKVVVVYHCVSTLDCVARIMANEPNPTLEGFFVAGNSVFVRSAERGISIVTAANEPGQYVLGKTPTAEMLKVAAAMIAARSGTPLPYPAKYVAMLNGTYAGCDHFHDGSIENPWKFRKCGKVAGLTLYRSGRAVVLYPAAVAARVKTTQPVLVSYNQ